LAAVFIKMCFLCREFCACGVLESVRRQGRLFELTQLNVTLSLVNTLQSRALDHSRVASCPSDVTNE